MTTTNHYSDSYITNQVNDIIDKIPEHIKSQYPNHSATSSSTYNKLAFLKTTAIKDFGVYATILNLPFYTLNKVQEFFYSIQSSHTYIYWCQPRFTMKTTFMCAYMSWLSLRDMYTQSSPNQAPQRPVIAFYHSNIYKAQENLKLAKDFLSNPIITKLFPEHLVMEVDTQKNLRFEDNSPIKRKESHFAAFSTESDPTGQHYTYIYNDDTTTWENTKTLQLNEINKSFYKKQVWLNDNSGKFQVFNTFTPYFDDTWYADMERAAQQQQQSSPLFYFKATIDDFPSIYNEKLIADTLTGCNNDMSYYRSQTYMEYFGRTNQSLNLNINNDSFTPNLPDTPNLIKIQSSDPSYSKKNKTFYDKSSKASILQVAYYDDVYYVYDAWLSLGEEFEDWVNINTSLASKYDIDIFVSDAQAYQQSLVNMIKDKLPSTVTTIPYKAKQSVSKIQAANDVLAQLFASGRIKIVTPKQNNEAFNIAIQQLKGEHPAMDFVDCLVYAVSETKALPYPLECYRRPRPQHNNKKKNGSLLGGKTKWRV